MRLLLVEDGARLAETLEASLVQQGYSVDVAHCAAEGDEIAVVEHHDVIIIDVLSDRDGVSLCRSLRRQKVSIPILMLSALTSTEHKVAWRGCAACCGVRRPWREPCSSPATW